jgi:hypothetical protein
MAEMLYGHIAVPVLSVIEKWYRPYSINRGRTLGS